MSHYIPWLHRNLHEAVAVAAILFWGGLWFEIPLFYFFLVFIYSYLPIILLISVLFFIAWLPLRLSRWRRRLVAKIFGLLTSLTLSLSCVALVAVYGTYFVQAERRFSPYQPKIETLLNQKVEPIKSYPAILIKAIKTVYEPHYDTNSALDSQIAWHTKFHFLVASGRFKRSRAGTIQNQSAISLMRDSENIKLGFHMREWHFMNILWSYALPAHFTKNEVLRLWLFYSPFGDLGYFESMTSTCFDVKFSDIDSNQALWLLAVSETLGWGPNVLVQREPDIGGRPT